MRVIISDDFSLPKIASSGQCFRVKEFGDGTYRFITGKNILYIKNADRDSYEVSCTDEEWKEIWVPYFDLKRNYLEIRKSIPAIDTYLFKAAIEGQGIRILCQDPWEIMVTFIISQRKSISAIKHSVELLATRFGSLITTPYEKYILFRCRISWHRQARKNYTSASWDIVCHMLLMLLTGSFLEQQIYLCSQG